MKDDPPQSKPCTKCGMLLTPFIHGYSVDSGYNTVPHYMYGHNCPALLKNYEDRVKEINRGSMSDQQKANARMLAGYMNAWGN